MSDPTPFESVARVPAAGDNVAIATRRLEAGTAIARAGARFVLGHTVLEGHRFAIEPIAAGAPLLSWGLPFGIALRDVAPGEYACNASILEVLAGRDVDFALPDAANFRDHIERYVLDEAAFRPGRQVAPAAQPATFEGFPRPGARGVGTRNFVVVLATTARASAFAQAVADRVAPEAAAHERIDGVVAATHTEGGGEERPNNLDMVLRTLAGFVVHPNVAAVLAVDYGTEPFDNGDLERTLREGDYPLDDVPHAFFRVDTDLESALDAAAEVVRGWLPAAGAAARATVPAQHLKVALQCGGSDAFSGVSGNALAGWVAKEIIRHGGSANLAETDELIGAEPYVLENVRDAETARRFLERIETFKARAAAHGTSAEGNPSGGNKYRGLYNIALKSIGAARKRDPEVRLDHVIDYGAPMREPGYYFMDSPGNDLESIAGQVASGANVIFFITGNGSITNFPFVPTLKFVTTTGRFELLANEMDVNAGRYADGESMGSLGRETFELALRIASGERSKGELAGHAQLQLWRDWRQTDPSRVEALRAAPAPDGAPHPVRAGEPAGIRFEAWRTARGTSIDRVGLVMPTSLCSGQPARLVAERLDAMPDKRGVSRFVALVHTEGCGSANTDDLHLRTMLGHLRHPCVARAVLLEHGCERTHNDAVRHYLAECGEDLARYGWASVQMDGGLQRVSDKIVAWFGEALADEGDDERVGVGAEALRLALMSSGALPDHAAEAFALVARGVVNAGGTVMVPEASALLRSDPFRLALFADSARTAPSLAYGQPAQTRGLHVMEAPTANAVETMTGLGGTGAEIVLVHAGDAPVQGHPMVPALQASGVETVAKRFEGDLDAVVRAGTPAREAAAALLERIAETASGAYRPALAGRRYTGFQLTRGLLGVSL